MKIRFPQIFSLVCLLVLAILIGLRAKQNRVDFPVELYGKSSVAAVAKSQPPEQDPEPTPEPTPAFEERSFVLSIVGDCTLASPQFIDPTEGRSIEYHIKQDYALPFSNTVGYFLDDDLTLANLECVLCDKKLFSYEQFSFRAPTAYAQIMLEGGVDFVTTANNHIEDFGEQGYESTYETLESYGLPYGKNGETSLFTTESGLTVGIYCCTGTYRSGFLVIDPEPAVAAVRQLREDGAEYVICAFHWGKELVYSPRDDQVELAHACIDAGADLIYGSHSHCLQPIEQYHGGVILYSMGNWVFGGSTAPTDKDTAIVQLQVERRADGSIVTTDCSIIPCCVSSRPVKDGYSGDNYNDYIPTPYTEGSEAWQRTMDKLGGEFHADVEGRDYSDVYAQYG